MIELSVIVPTWGPSPELRDQLRSLDELIPPGEPAEVILVVDGPDVLGADLEGLTIRSTVLTLGDASGAAMARNWGAGIARADVLAFLDDDVVVAGDWFADVRRRMAEDWDLLGGRLGSVRQGNLVSQMFETLVIRHGRVDGRWFLASANLLVRRPAFTALAGFDERYPGAGGEDWDLCRRAHLRGLTVVAVGDYAVHHRNPTRLRSLTSRARTYADSTAVRFADDRPRVPGSEGGVVEVAGRVRGGRGPGLRGIGTAVGNYLGRLAEIRRHGIGGIRAAMILVLHFPWFLTYALASVAVLRREHAAQPSRPSQDSDRSAA